MIVIEKSLPGHINQYLPSLSEVLFQTVMTGASVGFVSPFSEEKAAEFWEQDVFPLIESGRVILFIAKVSDKVVGCVLLTLHMMPNQKHRCEVAKLLVHPSYRRKGIARKLMEALLEEAAIEAKSLITLDTRSGDAAEPLYASLGFQVAGIIPDYAQSVEGARLDSTTLMYLKI
ncbi:GNAT family N-acetyltransferase [Flexibacterium corallicola]|uniref:GNAT family N-acetyltransferase n=1 Tax=Flexibacterium corallicola TaxID=3037259 RepID=UPI00286EB938|nr:GNAT family N-acetyltransferase [Pseudovibrio sp. M1P-2-3]